jgi:pyrimidine deaminase RibD-like protein
VVGRQRRLNELEAAFGERHGDVAAILRVTLAAQEAGVLQAAEPDAHRPRRAPHLGHQLALVQRVVLGPLERGQHQEARARQAMLGQRLLEL